MKGHRKISALLPVLLICSVAAAPPDKTGSAVKKSDTETGLKIAPGWEMVKSNCTACHSAKLITSHQGDRKTWLSMIRWMQATQGLWPLDHKTEAAILGYLASQYPAVRTGRRANLPAGAMPPNPWLGQ